MPATSSPRRRQAARMRRSKWGAPAWSSTWATSITSSISLAATADSRSAIARATCSRTTAFTAPSATACSWVGGSPSGSKDAPSTLPKPGSPAAIGPGTSSVLLASRSSPGQARSVTPIWTASPTARMPVQAHQSVRSLTRAAGRATPNDTKDKCPGTAAGTRVDAAGCPILFTEAKTPVVLRGVTFETGRSALKPDSYTILDIVAASLIANPDIKIEIGGHTDNTGASATNLRLSQARADAVRAYLASKGVGLERMVAKGYGASQPVAPNTTATGRAQNRRVQLRQTNW